LVNHKRGDVTEFRKASNKSGGRIENRLDGGESNLRKANKKRIAIVKPRKNKSMDYFSQGRCGHRVTNGSKAPKLIVRGTREVSDNYVQRKKANYPI